MASSARLLLSAFAVAVSLLAGGCHQKPGVWYPSVRELCQGKTCYRVGELDGGWRLVRKEGAAVGFYNQSVGGVIEANASCRDDADAAPLAALTHQLLIGYTERHIVSESNVPLAKREALHTVLDAKLDGVPMRLDLYVLKRNGCIFDLSYAAPPARAADGASAFERFVAGFSDERGAS